MDIFILFDIAILVVSLYSLYVGVPHIHEMISEEQDDNED